MQQDFRRLTCAYGSAQHIPALLTQAARYPEGNAETEPYFSLWSSLWHQGDIYPASIAAVPLLIAIAEQAPERKIADAYHLALSIAVTKDSKYPEAFSDVADDAYPVALGSIKPIALRLLEAPVEPIWRRIAQAGIAYAIGDLQFARWVLEAEWDLTCPHCERLMWLDGTEGACSALAVWDAARRPEEPFAGPRPCTPRPHERGQRPMNHDDPSG